MAGIAAALTNLAVKQLTGTFTVAGDVYTPKQVFSGPVPGNHTPAAPWIQNTWQFVAQDDVLAQDVHRYDISMQWFVGEILTNGTNILTAVTGLWENWLNIWVADQRLAAGGAATILSGIMVGGPALLEFNGKQYYGIDAVLSCQIERDTGA